MKITNTKECLRPTGSLAQAGVLPRGTLRRILEVLLPSEPYQYPRLPQAAKTLQAIELRNLSVDKAQVFLEFV